MSRVIHFSRHFHAVEGGSRKERIRASLTEISRSNGLEPPGHLSTAVSSAAREFDSLAAGDVVVCPSIVDLADVAELPLTLRKLLSRGIRVVSGETTDLVASLRVVESLCAVSSDLQRENLVLERQVATAEKLRDEISAELCAEMIDEIDRAFRVLVGHFQNQDAWGAAFMERWRARKLKAKRGEKSDA